MYSIAAGRIVPIDGDGGMVPLSAVPTDLRADRVHQLHIVKRHIIGGGDIEDEIGAVWPETARKSCMDSGDEYSLAISDVIVCTIERRWLILSSERQIGSRWITS